MPKIRVGEKALAHLSRGLYRSPASALRELVSNAWDANARVVRITTNAPHFHLLSISDNGDGFTRAEFERLMEGGIGNSQKRVVDRALINDRPLIGRLGIGMLGIAQICGSFIIISKQHDGSGFKAHVRFYDLLRERLDEEDEELVVKSEDDGEVIEEVEVGNYDFLDFDPSEVQYGTTILSEDVHPTFVRSFQQSVQHEQYVAPPRDWSQAPLILKKYATLQELGDYWRLMWELAASCPVPYISDKAIPEGVVREDNAKLKAYDFTVYVDGVKLLKPVLLAGNPGGYTVVKIDEHARKVYGRSVRFHGYIAVQEGSQLNPDELRGIMVRIKNIGIGYYDPSLLDYRYNEGPRSRWVTGEIFVNDGLENALNIDRDSFNRFHPEFRYLQEHVHLVLQKKVFPRVYQQIEVRSRARATLRTEKREDHLVRTIEDGVDRPVQLKFKQAAKGEAPSVEVRETSKGLQLQLPEPESLRTKKSQRHLAAAILGIFAVASRERTAEKRLAVFTERLLQLLAKW